MTTSKKYSIENIENIYKTFYDNAEVLEFCPECDKEVELKATFIIQICPECKKEILPCSICKDVEQIIKDYKSDCVNCPLEKFRKHE